MSKTNNKNKKFVDNEMPENESIANDIFEEVIDESSGSIGEMEETIVMLTGIVINAELLNVRKEPKIGSDVLCHIKRDSQLMIDITKSTDEWFAVCTEAGVDGYCMKKFVEIKQQGDLSLWKVY